MYRKFFTERLLYIEGTLLLPTCSHANECLSVISSLNYTRPVMSNGLGSPSLFFHPPRLPLFFCSALLSSFSLSLSFALVSSNISLLLRLFRARLTDSAIFMINEGPHPVPEHDASVTYTCVYTVPKHKVENKMPQPSQYYVRKALQVTLFCLVPRQTTNCPDTWAVCSLILMTYPVAHSICSGRVSSTIYVGQDR